MESPQDPKTFDGRKLKNFLLFPGVQLPYVIGLFAVGIAIISTIFITVINTVVNLLNTVGELAPFNQELQEEVSSTITLLWSTLGIVMVGVLLLSVFLGLGMTHRFAGPVVPLRRQIRAILDGHYSERIYLRETDALQELATDLNDLAQHFEKKAAEDKKAS